MSDIKIEKGVEIPKPKCKYPWNEMEIGDSFFVDRFPSSGVALANKRYAPKRFVSRTVEGGIRVWRVE